MTTNSFALYIGLPRAENLYQIKRGCYGISLRMANLIVRRFPEINKLWLLTGEGEMLTGNEEFRSVTVPFYDDDVCRAVGALEELRAVSEIVVPNIARCDLAMRYDRGAKEEDTAAGTYILLLRRRGGAEFCNPIADGEYVVLRGTAGEVVRIGESNRNDFEPRSVAYEVMGHIALKHRYYR